MKKAQLVIGLPETGKTTFLAALWHVAEQESIPTALTVTNLGEDDHHLNELCAAWLQCETVARSANSAPLVTMCVKDTITSNESELLFHDIAGESYERQWTKRTLDPEYVELAQKASGVLLFVHPKKVKEPERLEEYYEIVKNSGEPVQIKPRIPQNDPTSTILIDLLQNLFIPPINSKKLRVAVVVSAWDLIEKQDANKTPEKWVEERLPLLNQFFYSNDKRLAHKVFGLSAQGGDYTDDKQELLKIEPANRVKVITSDYEGGDLTQIVKWSMSLS
ncbi:MAG: hypothetical protein GKR92_03425 [Gammaproteobacteria bacterium]|nr:MAG: hypothetical protein GKR92_03425 [Gammaproteobacteria bacterium]